MPIYEYHCQQCGEFEVTQRITERPLSRCPTCKGKVKRLISNTSFQLKGTGWYITDYARKDRRSGKEGNGNGKSDSGTKATSETKEKKPAADTASKSSTS